MKKSSYAVIISIFVFISLLLCGCPGPGTKPPKVINEIYVANEGGSSVLVYGRTADGDVAPLRTISPIDLPHDVAVDTVHDEIFVAAGGGAGFVAVYDRSTSVLKRTLQGLISPMGIALDLVHNEIFVTDSSAAVYAYDRTAKDNDAPKRTISGGNTGLSVPAGIAVDLTDNEIFVADLASVLVYNRTDDGNVAPQRTIAGANTGVSSPTGIAIDVAENEIFVSGVWDVKVFDRLAGNTAPKRTISGGGISHLFGASLDTVNNELFVVFDGFATVNVYPKATTTSTSLRRIAGATTGLNVPRGICVVAQ
jgi:hypothetical protein